MTTTDCALVRTPPPPAVLLAALLSAVAAAPASAAMQPTEYQFFLLPEHCKARISDLPENRQGRWQVRFPVNQQRIDYWRSLLGNDAWRSLDRYCDGLIYLSMAQSPSDVRKSRMTQQQLFQRAAGSIESARSQVPRGTAIWAEMSVKRARALEGAGGRKAAEDLLVELVQLLPSSADIYVALAQTMERGGRLDEAIAVLEQGMETASKKGPILFYLARYYYDIGDLTKAAQLVPVAEQAGMKMDSLREQLGSMVPSAGDGSASTER